ncbi:hypothetical protein RB601_000209 [Gaeumannomyces tritici]
MATSNTRLSYIPLESNPDVFTSLARRLGLSDRLAFHDVLSLAEPDLLALVPRPARALVLAFPAPEANYERRVRDREEGRPAHDKTGDAEDVVWFRQTIYNACGLYALLHAVANGAGDEIAPDSVLSRLLAKIRPLAVEPRARALEADADVAAAHAAAAVAGDTEAPAAADATVDHHYICFVRSPRDGRLYELDGDLVGPVDLGACRGDGGDDDGGGDLLGEAALAVVRDIVLKMPGGEDGAFSLLALAPSS